MEFPTVATPAVPDDIENDICAHPECSRPVGLAGIYMVGIGRICGSCFRNLKRGIIMDENRELQSVWQK